MAPEVSRRGLITGLIAFGVTAPAIVRATSLMPVKIMRPFAPLYMKIYTPFAGGYQDNEIIRFGGLNAYSGLWRVVDICGDFGREAVLRELEYGEVMNQIPREVTLT